MIGASLILAASLAGQHFRESKHDEFHSWPNIRHSPTVEKKRAAQKVAMHAAAEKSRRDFEEAWRLLSAPALIDCPCHLIGGMRR